MRKIQIIAMFVILLCVCVGCTNYAEEYSENTIVVKKSGRIVEVAVEDYKDTKVKAEDLTAYISEQIQAYNEENGRNAVKQKDLMTEDMSKVKLVLQYKGIDDYNGFNSLDCKLIDYTEAEKDLLSGSFKNPDGKAVKKSDFKDVEGTKVLVMSEKTNIVLKGKIRYYNSQVTVKNGVITTSGKKDAIIIFK